MAELNEIMVSGEIDNIVVSGNIGYTAVQDEAYNGMFQRIENGITTLYKAPDQDVTWIDEDTTTFNLSTGGDEVLSLTVDQDVLITDGSFSITGSMSNTDNKNQDVLIEVFDDGVLLGTGEVKLLKDEEDKLFAFSGGVATNVDSGSVLTVEFTASKNGVVMLNGTDIPTKLRVIKAQAAPVVKNGKLDFKAANPAVRIGVEDGGLAGAFQIYDESTPKHLVASLEWLKTQQELMLALNDKDTGVIKAMLQLKADGKGYVGNGMIQDQIAIVDDIFNIQDNHSAASLANITTLGTYYVADTNAVDFPPYCTHGILSVTHYDYLDEKRQEFVDESSYRVYERWDTGAGFGDALDWKEVALSGTITGLLEIILDKADKTELPDTFNGTTEPLNALGKDYDRYHHYEPAQTGASDTPLYPQTGSHHVRDTYDNYFFFITSADNGDPIYNDITAIELSPSYRKAYVDLQSSEILTVEELILKIKNYGDPTTHEVVLTMISNTPGNVVATWDSADDAIIEAIKGSGAPSAEQSTFSLITRGEIDIASKERDYEKYNGEWQIRVDDTRVKEVIREFNQTVSMDTAHNKPDKAECIQAFKTLPNYDFAKDDTFNILSTNKGKYSIVRYLANGDTTEAGTNYQFWTKELDLAG